MGRLLARQMSGPSMSLIGGITPPAVFPQLTASCSIWVRAGSGSGGGVLNGYWNNAANVRFFIRTSLSTIQVVASNGLTYIAAAAYQKNIRKGDWVHVAFTWTKGGIFAAYFNGALSQASVPPDGAWATWAPNAAFTIGGDTGYGGGGGCYGVAEPAIFNRVLTAAEIQAIYEQGPSAYPQDGSCVLDYRFKEGAVNGATIVDSSGKGNHGVLSLGTGIIDPYNIPVPNRVLTPANMPLVAVETTGSTSIYITDSPIAAAFGVPAMTVGDTNGITVGCFMKKKKFGVNYPDYTNKYSHAGGRGVSISGGLTKNFTMSKAMISASNAVAFQSQAPMNTSGYNHYVSAAKTGTPGLALAFFDGNKVLARSDSTIVAGGGGISAEAFYITSASTGMINDYALPFIANRVLADDEVFNIYQSATFPPDVLFWHGPNEAGTAIACHRGTYGNRVPSCDAILGSGNTFTDDCPWR